LIAIHIQSFLFLPPGMKNLLSDNKVIQLLLAYDKDMLTRINEFPNHIWIYVFEQKFLSILYAAFQGK